MCAFLAGDVTHTQTLGIVGNLVDLKTIWYDWCAFVLTISKQFLLFAANAVVTALIFSR